MTILGMRGNGSWGENVWPENYRETIFFLYPNGSMPLTALMSMGKNEAIDSPKYHWWTKNLPTQRASITGVYTDAALSSAYTSGGVVGSVLYCKMSEDDSFHFRAGHQVLLRDASDFTVDVNAKVMNVSSAGVNSYVQVRLLEVDDNSSHSHDCSDADTMLIIGNINSEGAIMPTGVSYDPVEYTNLTQIWRTPLSITRTARKTRLRTGDAYKEMKREALELHGIEMEKSMLFGVQSTSVGDNGQPERTTEGLVTATRLWNPTGVSDFSLDSSYSGKLWLDDGGGEDWFDAQLMALFLYGRPSKLAFCGNGALLGINRLAKAGSHMTLTPTTLAYGMKVLEWVTPYGTIYLKTHPLFNYETTLRYSMYLFEPENLKFVYIDDTSFYGENQNGKTASSGTNAGRKDATDEEFLTEGGLEYHHPYTTAFLNGVGQDNTV